MDTNAPLKELTMDAVAHLPLDSLLALLANERRRIILQTLSEHPRLSLPDLAEEVAVREFDRPFDEIDEHSVLEIYTSLWHHHIPKLADVNVISYDQELDLVTLSSTEPPSEDEILRPAD